jgi:hypothetical protein
MIIGALVCPVPILALIVFLLPSEKGEDAEPPPKVADCKSLRGTGESIEVGRSYAHQDVM